MRLTAVVAALGCSTGRYPERIAGHLRNLLHHELTAEHRIRQRDVLDRTAGEHLADDARPVLPRSGTPEVIDPEEPALEEILPQLHHFALVEAHGANVRRDRVRTVEQRVVSQ